jgi:putative ABC transport system permease protein
MFQPGKQELIVGAAAAKRFHLDLGSTVHMRNGDWPIVGTFEFRGEILESYLVGDEETIFSATRRHGFAQVVTQLVDANAYSAFESWVTENPALRLTVERKVDYDRRQIGVQVGFFTRMAYLIGAIMAFGALFGVVKIMYSVVRARTREIGTLRAMGFGATPVAVSIVAEATLLGLLGALAGTALAWLIFDGHEIWVGGAVRLHVSMYLLALGVAWALTTSLVGGLFPAVRAARLPAYEALRAA